MYNTILSASAYLNIPDCAPEYTQVRSLFLVLRCGYLFLEHLETFFEMRTAVLLQFVVHFSGARSKRTPYCITAFISDLQRWFTLTLFFFFNSKYIMLPPHSRPLDTRSSAGEPSSIILHTLVNIQRALSR